MKRFANERVLLDRAQRMRRMDITSFVHIFVIAIAFVVYDEVTIIMRFFFSIKYAAVPLVIFFYVFWATMVGTMSA